MWLCAGDTSKALLLESVYIFTSLTSIYLKGKSLSMADRVKSPSQHCLEKGFKGTSLYIFIYAMDLLHKPELVVLVCCRRTQKNDSFVEIIKLNKKIVIHSNL